MTGLRGEGGRPWYVKAGVVLLGVLAVAAVQRGVLSHLPWRGVRPDLALVIVLLAGMQRGSETGVRWGVALGAGADVAGGVLVGAHLVSYAIGGYIAGWISRRIFRDTLLIPMAIVAGLTVVCHVIYQAIAQGFGFALPWPEGIRAMALPLALYNGILVLPVHGVLARLGGQPE